MVFVLIMITTAPPQAGFGVASYLEARAENPNFVMVEIGHNSCPVAFQQPFDFTGGRAYIGVEAWLRVGEEELQNNLAKRAEEEGEDFTRQNIFFVAQDIGGGIHSDRSIPTLDEPFFSWYEGPFDTQTRLPDGAGDEIYLGDVSTDPHIGKSEEFSAKLLAEVSRLSDSDGTILLKETMTPQHSQYILDDEFLALFGLSKAAFVTRADEEDWERLQAVYKGSERAKEYDPELSFYLFLSKIATA